MKIIKTPKEVNLLMSFVLVAKISKFLAVGRGSSPSPGFPINVCLAG